ncbi:hypothetical protein CA13_17380 [Planctomycetes bacterium CA13]|uniref:Nickel uptake substrate-specific transmembrane region n=2 Tax=Novipirellula herctigrandis TaxID=2527986 RepID=A0A5C5YZ33_9BACT|nr:hypothetical protein CA13_17380 [Planctomycetes bacterium CA13]
MICLVVGIHLFLCCVCCSVGAKDETGGQAPEVNNSIAWTEVPKVDKEDPTLQRGMVFGPDGQPLAGAHVYAASNIELFEIRKANDVSVKDLGNVRAVTDHLGRFEFHASDLTWTPASGVQKRWEALLVATKDGLTPGWIKTWGQDRGLRSHWNPHISKDVAIHMTKPTLLRGSLVGPEGKPLADALVTLTAINTPRDRDLDKHCEFLRNQKPSFFGYSTNFQETFYRPWLIPGLTTQTTTDAQGGFVFDGLPKDHVIEMEISHPDVRLTKLSVGVREMEDVIRAANEFEEEPRVVLRGSSFTYQLAAGITLRGQVNIGLGFGNGPPASGVTVALANHNASDGMTGKKFVTDDEGRFAISGLGPDYHDPGYDVALVGSFHAPIVSKRFTLFPDWKNRLKVQAAVPYRLKLLDAEGAPIDREVYSITVQRVPDTTLHQVTNRFDAAVRVQPGVYEGIIPNGPGAVIVKRGSRRDRPAMVNPKEFFEPGRTDWTAEEARYAYGDHWQITQPGIITTPRLSPAKNQKISQLNMAAVVLTRGGSPEETLELSATIHKDDPPNVTLVDESGHPVAGARVHRQLTKYNEKELPATFALHGLHHERSEFFQFHHDELGLIGSLQTTLTDKPLTVVMKPAATLRGRIIGRNGETSRDFGILVDGAVAPHTFLGNYIRNTDQVKKGTFALRVTPGETYSGQWMRKTYNSYYPRPLLGEAFAPITPKPGEIVDLGDLVTPQQ